MLGIWSLFVSCPVRAGRSWSHGASPVSIREVPRQPSGLQRPSTGLDAHVDSLFRPCRIGRLWIHPLLPAVPIFRPSRYSPRDRHTQTMPRRLRPDHDPAARPRSLTRVPPPRGEAATSAGSGFDFSFPCRASNGAGRQHSSTDRRIKSKIFAENGFMKGPGGRERSINLAKF